MSAVCNSVQSSIQRHIPLVFADARDSEKYILKIDKFLALLYLTEGAGIPDGAGGKDGRN